MRSKWLAVVLLILFLWAYEAFSLWDSPWLTAWIIVAYFVAAFVVDGLFRGAAFCKYLCPIGQFNFVQSLASPLEVKVRDPEVCTHCRTKDCIRGRDGIPGCELHLFQPRKQGNMDCTFCLDCVHACPHDNVGIIAGPPGRGLWSDVFRSGVGRFGKPPGPGGMVVVLVFGAFANAAGMVGPVAELQDRFQLLLGQRSSLVGITVYYVAALVVVPLLAVGTAAVVSRSWGRLAGNRLEVATRFSYALMPLGFGMWLAQLQLPLPDKLRHGGADGATICSGRRLGSGRAGVAGVLLPARGRVVASPGNPVPRRGSAAVAVCRLSHCLRGGRSPICRCDGRHEGVAAVGGAVGAIVRSGRVDYPATDADAWHSAGMRDDCRRTGAEHRCFLLSTARRRPSRRQGAAL